MPLFLSFTSLSVRAIHMHDAQSHTHLVDCSLLLQEEIHKTTQKEGRGEGCEGDEELRVARVGGEAGRDGGCCGRYVSNCNHKVHNFIHV